jgi:hypothetical protein
LSYSANKKFSNDDFALVALGAAKWALNKRIVRSKFNTPRPSIEILAME